ncbi:MULTISPECIES: hypothetical protein [Priestia]|jgi:hypothetical protein|nr:MULTISPECIES: hypothetical protein [Priestia]MED4028500.1 hypothetical protein [Priestia megaterium]MED4141504.1 hypothetical protein [Priestia megaterium]
MGEEIKPTLDDFVEDDQFELESYLTYLFDQINHDNEILSET